MVFRSFILLIVLSAVCGCSHTALRKEFANPSNEYRPMPFWHLNGHLTKEGVEQQIEDACRLCRYGGMTPIAVDTLPHWFDGHICPATVPPFMSEEYFERYRDMLAKSEELGTEIILYDDIDYPSGSAGGRLVREYPEYCRKYLVTKEYETEGGCRTAIPVKHTGKYSLLAVSALETETKRTVDLQEYIINDTLRWPVPEGHWKIIEFLLEYNVGPPHGHLVDFMEPEAVSKFMEMTYDVYEKEFGDRFGKVIHKVFFDDVGFVNMEQTWTEGISEQFRKNTGKNPALYYPALFYDIGPDTRAARIAFHDARAELLAEGYPKMVSDWAHARGLETTGHPPSNYGPNTVVACGDVLKFYRHVDIPLLDVIFHYGHGRDGYKQITSAADRMDKGVVGGELNAAFPPDMDSLTFFRTAMEAMVRGVNFLVPTGQWYDTTRTNIRIPPLITHSISWGSAIRNYSDFTSRSCLMLQGGQRVVDVAMLWPVQTLQAESWIYRDRDNTVAKGLPVATWLPDGLDNYRLSNILTDHLRCDFTYLHPEDFTNGKVSVSGASLVLNNKVNRQEYQVLLLPGIEVISAETMKAIKNYYDRGGKIIATTRLPRYSAEFGRDAEINGIVKEIFGELPTSAMTASNTSGGQFAYVSSADAETVASAFHSMSVIPDVIFDFAETPSYSTGCLNYTHKRKDGLDIYYFVNTTEKDVVSSVALRGHINHLEIWDPHSGTVSRLDNAGYRMTPDGIPYTDIRIDLPSVRSVFIAGKKKMDSRIL